MGCHTKVLQYNVFSAALKIDSGNKFNQYLGIFEESRNFDFILILVNSQVKISGVTGNIEFDMLGNRRNFLVQLLDVGLMEVHSRVGNWSHVRGELVLEADYKKTKDGAIESLESPNELVDIRKRSM